MRGVARVRRPSRRFLLITPHQSIVLDGLVHALADPAGNRGAVGARAASVSDLVSSEKAGRVRTCRFEPAALRAAEGWIGARRATCERRLDRLGHYLAEHPDEAEHGSEP